VALELGLTPIVHRFVAALEQKDPVTREHVVRVAELAMRCGKRAGFGPDRLRALGLGALLHDIGKLNAPLEILSKPGALTEDEFEVMKLHTVWGQAMLDPWPMLAPAACLVRWHHERADGRGYPDAIIADELPLEVGLISVCDAWDAMTSDRPYREGMEEALAMHILHDGAGAQWRADAVRILTDELRAGGRVTWSTFDHVGLSRARATFASDDDLVCVCLQGLAAPAPIR
jgi:HD-GYP domain-containing protein (c-di-GMP phosphodiesterase class II)